MSRSPPMDDSTYQDIGAMSDMTGMSNLDDLYSLRKVPIIPPNPAVLQSALQSGLPPIPESANPHGQAGSQAGMDPLLQAQLAMLHPIQKFQFLQQQIQNHQMANIQRQMKPAKKTVKFQQKNSKKKTNFQQKKIQKP